MSFLIQGEALFILSGLFILFVAIVHIAFALGVLADSRGFLAPSPERRYRRTLGRKPLPR